MFALLFSTLCAAFEIWVCFGIMAWFGVHLSFNFWLAAVILGGFQMLYTGRR